MGDNKGWRYVMLLVHAPESRKEIELGQQMYWRSAQFVRAATLMCRSTKSSSWLWPTKLDNYYH